MKRIYHPWHKWECYKAGMYANIEIPDGQNRYAEFLADISLFELSMRKVFKNWPYSCEQFLTNENINRIAWIGQTSMCIETGVPQKYRGGFFILTKSQQANANAVAFRGLQWWIHGHEKDRSIHRPMEENGLF